MFRGHHRTRHRQRQADVDDQRRANEHVRRLLCELDAAREAERRRIAGELHDFPLQQLAAALMHLELAEGVHHATGRVDGEQITNADQLVREAVTALQRIMGGLRPVDLDGVNLADALDIRVRQLRSSWSIPIVAQVKLSRDPAAAAKLTIYRLVCEALINACKHSGASVISLEVDDRNGRVVAQVADNGRGITEQPINNIERPMPGVGMGMHLMLEHVLYLGGSYEVQSAPGEGTTLCFEVPLEVTGRRLERGA